MRSQIDGNRQIQDNSIPKEKLKSNFLKDYTWVVSDNNSAIVRGLADPVQDQDAVNKRYVDSLLANSVTWKKPVRVKAQSNIDLTQPVTTIDGITLNDGDRVALFDQNDGTENGIYVYDATSQVLARASDFQQGLSVSGTVFSVEEGTDEDTVWIITNDKPNDVVGVHDLQVKRIGINDIYMQESNPVPVNHGGLEAGTDINGMSVRDVLHMILYPYQYPSFTQFYINAQPSIIEVGDVVNGGVRTFTWSTSNSQNIQPNSIAIKDVTGNVVLGSNLANDGTEDLDIGADKQLTSPGTYTWQISGLNTKNQTFTRNFTVRWEYRVYWGYNANDTLTEIDVKNLQNSQLKQNFSGNYSFSNPGSLVYYYWVWPDTWGLPNSITDTDTGFAVDWDDNGTVDVTNAFGVTTTYRVIRTTYQQNADLNSSVN